MNRIFRELPPRGTKVGLAFSGGLDTRTAVAWMAREGISVYAYTADLAQPDEKKVANIPKIALTHGAKAAKLVDCKAALAEEGLSAIACCAFHLSTGGRRYFNTTPLGRVVTSTGLVEAMAADDVHVFGDGSTHRGNDIQRFFRYGIHADPTLRIYKPWLDHAFVDELGGRTEMSRFLASAGLPYTMSAEKAYSTDSNMLGATHEAKDLERLDVSMHVVQPIMGVAHWLESTRIKKEIVTIGWKAGRPTTINGKSVPSLVDAILEANRIGGQHGFGMSDQIENRVIEAKSRGVYEAPGMALLSLTYERLVSAIHNENTMAQLYDSGRRLGRLLYEGRWLDPEAAMLKSAARDGVARYVEGEVTVELRRGDDYTILDTKAPRGAYAPEGLSMEKTAGNFTPEDRIGALEVQTTGILANRAIMGKISKSTAKRSRR